jgi:hypothetical protein
MTYSARLGADGGEEICRAIPFAAGADRTIAQHGVESVEIKVPAWRLFNTLIFLPAEDGREEFHLDDVSLQWRPAEPGAPRGSDRRLSEDFESDQPGASEFPGRPWQVEASPGAPAAKNAPAFFIERSTSFGPGTRCLRAAGGGKFSAPIGTLPETGPLTIDLDLFVRSGKSSPILMPDPAPRSPHSVTISVEAAAPLARVAAVDGTWRLWDGTRFIDTGRPVILDGWGHLQLVIDPRARTFRLVTQPVGEAPQLIATGPLAPATHGPLRLVIEPSPTPRQVSCFDNIEVTGP